MTKINLNKCEKRVLSQGGYRGRFNLGAILDRCYLDFWYPRNFCHWYLCLILEQYSMCYLDFWYPQDICNWYLWLCLWWFSSSLPLIWWNYFLSLNVASPPLCLGDLSLVKPPLGHEHIFEVLNLVPHMNPILWVKVAIIGVWMLS
jgi:hypothetical protein